jgi:uncharacterized membrane protein (UPF0127 family)
MRRFRDATTLSLECPSGETVELWLAESLALRLAGLALLRPLPPARGLLIPRCRSVHTFAMLFAIDVLFVRARSCETFRVVAVRRRVQPLRIAAVATGARDLAAIELGAGAASRLAIEPGCYVTIESPRLRLVERQEA